MMLDILINLKIDDFYWVDVLNPINSQEPVLQMVAIPPSYFRIVGGGGKINSWKRVYSMSIVLNRNMDFSLYTDVYDKSYST